MGIGNRVSGYREPPARRTRPSGSRRRRRATTRRTRAGRRRARRVDEAERGARRGARLRSRARAPGRTEPSGRRAPSPRAAPAPRPSSNRARPRGARRRRHHTPRASGLQMYLCACSCSRTSSRSSRIHRASIAGLEHAVHGREQHGRGALAQPVAHDDVPRVVEVGAIGDDELHFVVPESSVEVRPVHLRRLAAARTLHVDDRHDLVGHDRRSARGRRFRAGPRCPRGEQRDHERDTSVCSSGSPPVSSTSRHSNRATSATTSSTDILRPPVNAYGVSHHPQRRSHAASRTNTHGRPTCVDSPWMDDVDLEDRQHWTEFSLPTRTLRTLTSNLTSLIVLIRVIRRHVRLELPDRPRDVERHLLSVAAPARLRRAGVLRRALRHRRGELDVLPHAGAGSEPRLAAAHAGVVSLLRQAVPEVHAPGHVPGARRRHATGISRAPTSICSGAASIRSPTPAGSRRVLVAVSAELSRRAGDARLPRLAARRARGVSARRRAAPPIVERRG